MFLSWSKEMNIPFFSFDYRLAPNYTFPYCLDDVWQAYKYIVENVERLYGIKPNKIIMTGDSAGG